MRRTGSIPLTGDFKIDAVIAIIFVFYGIWMVSKYGNRFGWALMLGAAVWGYLLYSKW